MTMQRYGQYKDSGVAWLGEVPAHWDVTRLKFVAQVQTGVAKGKDYAGKDMIEVPYLRVANVQDGYMALDDVATIAIPANDLARYRLKRGDVLMNEGGDFDKLGRGHVWDGSIDPCIHQNHVFAVRPFGVSPEWLNLFTGAVQAQFYFMSRSKQSTNLASISSTNVMELPVLVPPPEERTRIAQFLAYETGQIDALVDEQRRLIALLKEKRQAVISQAVTKGLDPSAPMKDSGVEWLGAVPAHWRVGSAGFHLSILSGYAFPSSGFGDNEESPKLLRGVNVGVSRLRWDEVVYWDRKPGDGLDAYKLNEGDLVIGMDRPLIAAGIRVAKVSSEDLPCLLLQRVASISTHSSLDSDFLHCLISSEFFIAHFSPETTGVSVPHISPEQIQRFKIPVPPIGEQEAIAKRVDRVSRSFDELTAESIKAIEVLQERRAALISAAVTGKIDVRSLVPQPETVSA